MNLVRLGRVVRALRRRRGWRQRDLAKAVGISQQAVSLVECGRADRLSIRTVDRILRVLEAELDLIVRWRGGELERLLDEVHASTLGATARLLEDDRWTVRPEVTYATARERGSIDLFAFRPDLGTLLVVEVKSDVTSADNTLRRHDEKARIAGRLAQERFGWRATSVSRLLVLPDTTTARRRLGRHASLFDAAYPLRGRALRAWLRAPAGVVAGVLFLPPTKIGGDRREVASQRRVRVARRRGA